MPGISGYAASFAVSTEPGATVLTWSASFRAADEASLVRMLGLDAAAVAAMGAALSEHFAPAA